jgi:hypothetical protein
MSLSLVGVDSRILSEGLRGIREPAGARNLMNRGIEPQLKSHRRSKIGLLLVIKIPSFTFLFLC